MHASLQLARDASVTTCWNLCPNVCKVCAPADTRELRAHVHYPMIKRLAWIIAYLIALKLARYTTRVKIRKVVLLGL